LQLPILMLFGPKKFNFYQKLSFFKNLQLQVAKLYSLSCLILFLTFAKMIMLPQYLKKAV